MNELMSSDLPKKKKLGAWSPCTFFCFKLRDFEILRLREKKIDFRTLKRIQNPVKHLRWGVLENI